MNAEKQDSKNNNWIYNLMGIIAKKVPTSNCFQCKNHYIKCFANGDDFYLKRICKKGCQLKTIGERCKYYKEGKGLSCHKSGIYFSE